MYARGFEKALQGFPQAQNQFCELQCQTKTCLNLKKILNILIYDKGH